MMGEAEDTDDVGGAHVWMVYGDLMAGLLGIFVLFFVWLVVFQLDLAGHLLAAEATATEAQTAQAVAERRWASERDRVAALETAKTRRLARLERALAGPIAEGQITLEEGRIGIAGNVLFDLFSADLSDDGRRLLSRLAKPLRLWLEAENEMIMVGGFTDDLAIHGKLLTFVDNWQLSTERALTVVRSLEAAGLPPERLFAAGFGAHHPAVPNTDEISRARNRRVEIVPQAWRGR